MCVITGLLGLASRSWINTTDNKKTNKKTRLGLMSGTFSLCLSLISSQPNPKCLGSSCLDTSVLADVSLSEQMSWLHHWWWDSSLRCTDTSDPGHFRPKTVRHCIFGTEMSYFFSASAEVSLGHFGTSAELSQHFMKGPKCPTDTSALVPKCLGQIGGAFLFLYRFTTSRHNMWQ